MNYYVLKSEIAEAEKFIGGGENWAQIEALCAKANAKCKVLPAFTIGIEQDPGDQMLAHATFTLELSDWLVFQYGYLSLCKNDYFISKFTKHEG